jgi:hypothetical protein
MVPSAGLDRYENLTPVGNRSPKRPSRSEIKKQELGIIDQHNALIIIISALCWSVIPNQAMHGTNIKLKTGIILLNNINQ